MRTRVDEASDLAILGTQGDDRGSGKVERTVVARCGNLALVTCKLPAGSENLTALDFEDFRIRIDARADEMVLGHSRGLLPLD
jgi:hypothetical protein